MTNAQTLALFTSEDGKVRLQLKLGRSQDNAQGEPTLWLTQKQIAEVYGKTPKTISEHVNNIYDEGELDPQSTIWKFRTVAREGTRDVERLLDHYNLDAVLAVGYRVRSSRGTQFKPTAKPINDCEMSNLM